MELFLRLIEALLAMSVLIHLISNYLIINKLWSRRAVKEVAESISIWAALLGLATAVPFLFHNALVLQDPSNTLKTGISIVTGIVFVLISSGLFLTEYRGKGFLRLVMGALKLEGRESTDLLKALVQPTGAKELILVFEAMASVDKHIDAREIEMIKQFAHRWKVDPPDLVEGEAKGKGDVVEIRRSVERYLAIRPPAEQAQELLDVLHLFVQADAKVTAEEELVLEELTGMISQYVSGTVGDRSMFEVVIVPQSDEQQGAVKELLPGVEPKVARGGTVFSAGHFFSSRYAEAVCEKYIALGLFTTRVDP